MYPNYKQQQILKKWFGTSRFVYNKTLDHTKNVGLSTFETLRNKFVTYTSRKGVINPDINLWETETPKDVRASAVKDVTIAYSAAFTNLKRGNISKFSLGFRKKRDCQSLGIPKCAVNFKDGKLTVFPRTLGNLTLKTRTLKKMISVEHDCRLTYNGLAYFLCVPVKCENSEHSKNQKIVALDPGLRTFITGYSTDQIFKIERSPEVIKKIRAKIDLLKSLRDRKKLRNKKKILKSHQRLRNIVDDLHWKTISFLVKNYTDILLPSFESQAMMGSIKSVNRTFNDLKHYQFKMRLTEKVKHVSNTRLYIVDESYTSKTCTNCGVIKADLGSSKIYQCDKCSLIIDRDVNGARNILIKNVK